MINDPEIIKKTKFFGLNTYEAKIWIALLSRGVSTAGELSDIATIPRSRSYDVLESLRKKGFVDIKETKPIKYLAVPPKDVLDNLKIHIEQNTEKHLSEIKSMSFNSLIDAFQELYDKNTNNTENVIAILRGRDNIDKHVSFLLNKAKKEIYFSNDTKSKNYSKSIRNSKATINTPQLGSKICVVDEENTLIFPINDKDVHPDYELCIWIRNKQTSKFLKQLLINA